jgi:hypothetical protein
MPESVLLNEGCLNEERSAYMKFKYSLERNLPWQIPFCIIIMKTFIWKLGCCEMGFLLFICSRRSIKFVNSGPPVLRRSSVFFHVTDIQGDVGSNCNCLCFHYIFCTSISRARTSGAPPSLKGLIEENARRCDPGCRAPTNKTRTDNGVGRATETTIGIREGSAG